MLSWVNLEIVKNVFVYKTVFLIQLMLNLCRISRLLFALFRSIFFKKTDRISRLILAEFVVQLSEYFVTDKRLTHLVILIVNFKHLPL